MGAYNAVEQLCHVIHGYESCGLSTGRARVHCYLTGQHSFFSAQTVHLLGPWQTFWSRMLGKDCVSRVTLILFGYQDYVITFQSCCSHHQIFSHWTAIISYSMQQRKRALRRFWQVRNWPQPNPYGLQKPVDQFSWEWMNSVQNSPSLCIRCLPTRFRNMGSWLLWQPKEETNGKKLPFRNIITSVEWPPKAF